MILGVHHPGIVVPDMELALAFYCGVLGFEVALEAEVPSGVEPLAEAMGLSDSGFKVRKIVKGNSCIELFEFKVVERGDVIRPANQIGIAHIALASDDIEVDFARLTDAGVKFNCDLTGDIRDRFAYGRDPFGNILELIEHDPSAPEALKF